MIHGFFDDSGKESEPGNKIIVIAGYVTPSASVWQGFAEIWKNVLFSHNLEWLHMKDFMSPASSMYADLGWDWDKKKSVLEDFSAAIKMSKIAGFGVALDVDAWRKCSSITKKTHGSAQEFCFMRILRMVVERIKRSAPDERISILFDCDRNFTPARFQKYIKVRDQVEDANRYLAAFTVGEPRTFLPLQAADLLAWEVRRHVIRTLDGLDSRPEFNHLMTVLPGFFPDYSLEFWNEEKMRRT